MAATTLMLTIEPGALDARCSWAEFESLAVQVVDGKGSGKGCKGVGFVGGGLLMLPWGRVVEWPRLAAAEEPRQGLPGLSTGRFLSFLGRLG